MFLRVRQKKYASPGRQAGQLSNQGILLIEALLTVLVMTVCLTVIMRSQISNLQGRALTTEYTQAMWAFENKMFMMFIAGSAEKTAADEGLPEDRYAVTSTAEKGSGGDHLEKVIVDVRWGDGQRSRTLSVETSIFNPSSGG